MWNLLQSKYNSLVYDIGSSSIQFGFAGDAVPLFNIPSAACQLKDDGDTYFHFGKNWLEKKIPGIEEKRLIDSSGSLTDANLLSSFFDWTYEGSCLSIDSGECPILVSQPSHLTLNPENFDKWRESVCEIAFEFAQHPMVCLEYDSVLACFAHSSSTAVVVDFGWSCVRSTPILEGRPLLKSMRIGNIGGSFLCSALENYFLSCGKVIQTILDDPNNPSIPTESQRRCCTRFVLEDIIRSCLTFGTQEPNIKYYMPGNPNGINVQDEMRQLLALIWNPNLPQKNPMIIDYLSMSINNNNTPADVRRQLWANIVTSGGLSGLPNFRTQLEVLARARAPKNYAPKVLQPMHRLTSADNTVWTGGSILASLDNFDEFCITKNDWEEEGKNILKTKCL
ncbi:Actin family protein [Histomonas meleagridis]|uniref:Actin family protein n=1 Tax=Histomonas meleagridis TaxID=135588 RepID=UPI00355AC965|nr:Actin family protein [Histomonas meleagridis]KAH0796126.1 Actin family protein [Histomonas meleagridis]